MRAIAASEVGLPEPIPGGPFSYDDDKHKYRMAGRIIPSTSAILDLIAPLDWRDEDAMEKGTHVHLATELHDLGELDYESLTAEYKGYLAGWEKFLAEHRELVHERAIIEAPIYAKAPKGTWLEYGATPDRVFPDIGLGIDIKSGASYSDRYEMQAQAYMNALRTWGVQIDTMLQVHLYEDGDYRILGKHKFDRAALNIFKSALTVWRYKNRKKRGS